ncbi:type-1 angiotensin II receptor A-like [Saccostrea cucullata]|uniref:type-1 angiotensin II receptor A-like n=1 Tax=Saccostrea cuccullata TaxID=36930 RepID=UPI002ED56F70
MSFHLFNSNAIEWTSEWFEKLTVVLVLIIGLLGFVGNVVTICTVLCHKKFHTPTFVAISCLALSDTLNIIKMFLDKFSNWNVYFYVQLKLERDFWVIIISLMQTIEYCSNIYIVFLAMIRYLLTVQPLESKIRLTASIVMVCSIMIWLYASLFSAFIFVMIFFIFKNSPRQFEMRRLLIIIINILWELLSLCAIIIIHTKKMKALKNSSVRNNIYRRMNETISEDHFYILVRENETS